MFGPYDISFEQNQIYVLYVWAKKKFSFEPKTKSINISLYIFIKMIFEKYAYTFFVYHFDIIPIHF